MTKHRVCFKCKKIYDYPFKPSKMCNHQTYQYNTELRDLPTFEDEQIFEDENNEAKA